MPKRVIDFDAMWGSDKLAACAEWAQAEYAWLYGLADASGCFEVTNLRVIWGRVAAIRRNLTIGRLEQIFFEFQDKGLLFVWEHEGKRYGHWTGSDVPGRLPPPSWRMRLERLAPPVPKQQLMAYVSRFARGRASLGGGGFRAAHEVVQVAEIADAAGGASRKNLSGAEMRAPGAVVGGRDVCGCVDVARDEFSQSEDAFARGGVGCRGEWQRESVEAPQSGAAVTARRLHGCVDAAHADVVPVDAERIAAACSDSARSEERFVRDEIAARATRHLEGAEAEEFGAAVTARLHGRVAAACGNAVPVAAAASLTAVGNDSARSEETFVRGGVESRAGRQSENAEMREAGRVVAGGGARGRIDIACVIAASSDDEFARGLVEPLKAGLEEDHAQDWDWGLDRKKNWNEEENSAGRDCRTDAGALASSTGENDSLPSRGIKTGRFFVAKGAPLNDNVGGGVCGGRNLGADSLAIGVAALEVGEPPLAIGGLAVGLGNGDAGVELGANFAGRKCLDGKAGSSEVQTNVVRRADRGGVMRAGAAAGGSASQVCAATDAGGNAGVLVDASAKTGGSSGASAKARASGGAPSVAVSSGAVVTQAYSPVDVVAAIRSSGDVRANSSAPVGAFAVASAGGASGFSCRDKSVLAARELVVGRGPVCGPVKIKAEALERIRARDAAGGGRTRVT